MEFQKLTQDEINQKRSRVLTRSKLLDDMEDLVTLKEEACEQRRCRGVVVDEDHKREIVGEVDQIFLFKLCEGDANTRFFYLVANGGKGANQILRLEVGEQEYIGTEAIGQVIASHLWAFTKKGKQN